MESIYLWWRRLNYRSLCVCSPFSSPPGLFTSPYSRPDFFSRLIGVYSAEDEGDRHRFVDNDHVFQEYAMHYAPSPRSSSDLTCWCRIKGSVWKSAFKSRVFPWSDTKTVCEEAAWVAMLNSEPLSWFPQTNSNHELYFVKIDRVHSFNLRGFLNRDSKLSDLWLNYRVRIADGSQVRRLCQCEYVCSFTGTVFCVIHHLQEHYNPFHLNHVAHRINLVSL